MEFRLLNTNLQICILLCLFSLQFISAFQRRDKRIKDIKKTTEIDQLKSYKNGSIVLFFESYDHATKRVEQTLLKADNNIDRFGFKLRKVDCKKHSKLKECRRVDEPLVYLYKQGESRLYEEFDLNTHDLAVNQILFFMANANHDNMVDCANMVQADEFVEINTSYLNTVVASFKQKDSEYLRRFLEVVMDLGRTVAFLLVSGNQVKQSLYNKRGYFIRFHFSLKPSPGEKIRYEDISAQAHTQWELKKAITVMNLADEFKMHRANLDEAQRQERNAPEIKEKMIAEEKRKATEELHKQMEEQRKASRGGAKQDLQLQKPSRPEPSLALHVKEGLSEVSKDAFAELWDQGHIPKDKPYLMKEAELRSAITKNEGVINGILLVMFYVPWEPTFQMFETFYQSLGDKYNTDLKSNVRIVQLDCWEWYTICIEYKITTFPRLIVFRNGMEPFDYKGVLEMEAIAKHVSFWQDSFLPEITDMRQVEQITSQMSKVFLIGMFSNDSSVIDVRQKEFEQLAFEFYGSLRIAISIVKEKEVVFRGENHATPFVIAGNAGNEKGRIVITREFDTDKLRAWIHNQKREKVEELTYKNLPSLLAAKKPFLILFQKRDKNLSPLHRFADKFSDLITVWMDEDSEMSQSIMETYNLKKNSSKVVILDKINNKVFEFKDGKKTIGNVAQWVEKCLKDPETYATHALTSFKEVVNEGYDFLKLTDEMKGNYASDMKNEEKPVSPEEQWDIYNKAMGIQKEEKTEDPNTFYEEYAKLKYRDEL